MRAVPEQGMRAPPRDQCPELLVWQAVSEAHCGTTGKIGSQFLDKAKPVIATILIQRDEDFFDEIRGRSSCKREWHRTHHHARAPEGFHQETKPGQFLLGRQETRGFRRTQLHALRDEERLRLRFCTAKALQDFLVETPFVQRMLVEDGDAVLRLQQNPRSMSLQEAGTARIREERGAARSGTQCTAMLASALSSPC